MQKLTIENAFTCTLLDVLFNSIFERDLMKNEYGKNFQRA